MKRRRPNRKNRRLESCVAAPSLALADKRLLLVGMMRLVKGLLGQVTALLDQAIALIVTGESLEEWPNGMDDHETPWL